MSFLQVSNNAHCTPYSMKTSSGETILHVACEERKSFAVMLLLNLGAGANPDATDIGWVLHH